MSRQLPVLQGILTAAVVAVLHGCSSGDGSSTGTLNLAITDAPVDHADEVVMEFTGVKLKGSGGIPDQSFSFDDPATPDVETMVLDLMQYQNGNAAVLLDNEEIPAGRYNWILLELDTNPDGTIKNSYIEIDGAQYPLRVPSGEQNGLRLVSGFIMTANQVADFTIDFVLRKAVVAPPGSQIGDVQLYYVRPAMRLIDNVEAGALTGNVALGTLQALEAQSTMENPIDCFDDLGQPTAHVYIFDGHGATLTDIQSDALTGEPPPGHVNPVVTPEVQVDGTDAYFYLQEFLLAGDYTVALTCSPDDPVAADDLVFEPVDGIDTAVAAGQTTAGVNF